MSIISRLFGSNYPETKVCTICGEEKLLDDYYIKNRLTGRRFSWCKACHNRRTLGDYYRRTEPQREAKRNAPKPTAKRCSHCGEVKSIELFHRWEGDRRASWCIACRSVVQADYREANRERIRASAAEYYANNREVIAERLRQWHRNNPDRAREIRSRTRKKHADRVRAYNSRYQRENAARYNAYWHARRARKFANGGSHTVEEWEECKAYFDYHCLMCGRREPDVKLTKDHITPINLGGTDDIENIQPLCQRCNSSKSDTILDLRADWE